MRGTAVFQIKMGPSPSEVLCIPMSSTYTNLTRGEFVPEQYINIHPMYAASAQKCAQGGAAWLDRIITLESGGYSVCYAAVAL